MYTDVVNEFFIERKTDGRRMLKYIGIAVLVLVMVALLIAAAFIITAASIFCVIFSIVFIVLGVIMIRRLSVEYEYSFVTGDFRADKIMYKTRRVPLFKIDVKNVEKTGLYNRADFDLSEFCKVYNVTDSDAPEGCLYLKIASHNVATVGKKRLDSGYVLILVQNDERVHKAIKQYMKASVYREAFKGGVVTASK